MSADPPSQPSRLIEVCRRALREPLLQFTLIGLALFVIDHALGGSSAGSTYPKRIVVTASQQAALRDAFRTERGRDPSAEELRARLSSWIDEEVLYREAMALGLDRKDAIVRRQLAQKMRFLLSDAALLPEPDDAQLQDWLDRHAERYGRPGTVSFQQVFLSRGQRGDRLVADADAIQAKLSRHPDAYAGLGDPSLSGQVVEQASAVRLRAQFGPEFAAAVESLPSGSWAGPVRSALGLHLVRVTARTPFQPATLAQVKERVRTDFRVAERERLNQAAFKRLRDAYRIELESSPDDAARP